MIRRCSYYIFRCLFCVATIRGGLLFEGGYYSRVATIRGRLLFEGGYYSRAATIQGRLLFEGGVFFFGKPGGINDGWIRGVLQCRCCQ